MGIAILFSVAELLHQPGRRVAQVQGYGQGAVGVDVAAGGVQGDVAGVGFGGAREVGDGVGEGDGSLGQSGELERGKGAGGDDEGHRVGVADVFAGEDHHAAQDEQRVFAGVDHAKAPVQGCVGIAAAHRLDKGADDVVVLLAVLVVEEHAALHGHLDVGALDERPPVGQAQVARHLEAGQEGARVARGGGDQHPSSDVVDGDVAIFQPALVGQRAIEQRTERLGRHRLQHEHAAARQ